MAIRLTERQYELLLTGSQKFAVAIPVVMMIILPLVFTLTFSLSGVAADAQAMPPFFPWFPFVFFFAFAGYYFWRIARLPYRIVTAGQSIEFKSLLDVRRVNVSELMSIEPRSLGIQANISGYALRYRDGKILFPGQFTGLHVLLTELGMANPALEIRGC